jgi:hypothetical protein
MTLPIDRHELRGAGRGLLALLLGALALSAGGCNIVGPAMILIEGPGEVEAAYKLDPTKKTVIFVDDPANKIAQRRIRSQIGSVAQDTLLQKKLVREGYMIDARSALAVADRGIENGSGTGSKLLSVTEIGEAVGAEVVIYVLITRFDVVSDSPDFAPISTIEVKIFDVTTHSRLWPAGAEQGYRTDFSKRTSKIDQVRSRSGALQAQSDLARLTGLGLAQMFYDVERPQSLRR